MPAALASAGLIAGNKVDKKAPAQAVMSGRTAQPGAVVRHITHLNIMAEL